MIIPVTAYEVECDGCKENLSAYSEFSGWGDQGQACDEAVAYEWLVRQKLSPEKTAEAASKISVYEVTEVLCPTCQKCDVCEAKPATPDYRDSDYTTCRDHQGHEFPEE